MRSWPATFFPAWSAGAAAAAAIDLGLLVLVLKLDADYLEGAAAISQKLYERMRAREARRRPRAADLENRGSTALPRLPWLGGAGPLAWRQLLLAMRTSRLVILISLGTRLRAARDGLRHAQRITAEGRCSYPRWALGFIAYLTFLFAMQLPWAFRGDIDHMDSLKSLPVAPLAAGGRRACRGRPGAGGHPARRAGGPPGRATVIPP